MRQCHYFAQKKKRKRRGKEKKKKTFLRKSNNSYDPSQLRFLNKEDIEAFTFPFVIYQFETISNVL